MVVLTLAALTSLVVVLHFLTRNGEVNALIIINGSGLVLVVFATILVVVISKSEQQLTAAIGILGAIVGYLFGTGAKNAQVTPQADSSDQP